MLTKIASLFAVLILITACAAKQEMAEEADEAEEMAVAEEAEEMAGPTSEAIDWPGVKGTADILYAFCLAPDDDDCKFKQYKDCGWAADHVGNAEHINGYARQTPDGFMTDISVDCVAPQVEYLCYANLKTFTYEGPTIDPKPCP